MATKAKSYIPEGNHTVTPYLIVRRASEAIDFYKKVFDAKELYRLPMPGGRVGHAELQIGSSRVMLADEFPEMDVQSPEALGGTPVSLALYVENSDAWFDRAVKAGAKALRPMADQPYGDRSGTFIDPYGHKWTVSTHIEDVTPEELQKRMEQSSKK